MRQISFFLIALAVSIQLSVVAKAEMSLAPPDITRSQLDNGLEIVIIPDRRAPVVTHMMWYKAGSADEPRGKSGIAHFLEHLMFKGTKNVEAGEFSRKVAEIGGQENAFTTVDFTAYYQKISPDALEMVMGYEADRMENLILNDSVIEPEKNVILEERRSRVDSNPRSILGETVDAALFKHHPYGTPIIGWQNEMLELTKEDAVAFYDRFYSPNNAILVVAGDVEIAEVLAMAERTYGKVKQRVPNIIRERVIEPEPTAARTIEYEDARVTQPSFSRLYLVPSYQNAGDHEAEALELLADILGGSSTSRIYKSLILDKEIATSAGSWYQGSALDMTRFGFYGSPRGETLIEQVEDAIDEVIADVVANGVTEQEVDRARNNLLKSVIFERDSQTTMARLYGTVLSLGGTLQDVDEWPKELGKVTAEDVNAVAKKYLKKSRSVTSFLRPLS
ncbi:MAG: pitrilysin family protein [Salaquimonas sp.]